MNPRVLLEQVTRREAGVPTPVGLVQGSRAGRAEAYWIYAAGASPRRLTRQ
jgi:hypothetical protein